MKKVYTLAMVFSFVGMFAQQLENNGFESWEDVGTVADEPTEWSSIKTGNASGLVISGAPQIWDKSTDAHSGTYSVKLECKSSFGVVATGTVTNGRIYATFVPEEGYAYTDQSDSQWNLGFTVRPDSMVGWYKATPQSGDHGKAEVILHTGAGSNPENGTAGNFVGRARFELPTTTVSSWTRFSVPFNYFNSNDPEYALAVLASGDSTISKDGSIALFDDIEFIYNPVSVEEIDISQDVHVFTNGANIFINTKDHLVGGEIRVFEITGKLLVAKKLNSNTEKIQLNSPTGVYLCEILKGSQRTVKKVIFN